MPPSVHGVGWEPQADSFALRVLPANQGWGPLGLSLEEMARRPCKCCLLMAICILLLSFLLLFLPGKQLTCADEGIIAQREFFY